jgi:hypothetical protein
MRTLTRVGGAGLVVLACGWPLLGGRGQAGEGDKVKGTVLKIADLHEKADEAGAGQQAKAVAKQIEDVGDVMVLLKPRNKKPGLGGGPTPYAIAPDGIEQMIMALSRDGIPPEKLQKQAKALERLAYVSAAVMDVALAKPPEKDEGTKTIKLWNESARRAHDASMKLAKAARDNNAAGVREAAAAANAACTNCHNEFR